MLSPWSSPPGQARPLPDAARPGTSTSADWGGEELSLLCGRGRESQCRHLRVVLGDCTGCLSAVLFSLCLWLADDSAVKPI